MPCFSFWCFLNMFIKVSLHRIQPAIEYSMPCFSFWCFLNLFIKVSLHRIQPRNVLFSTILIMGAISVCFLCTSALLGVVRGHECPGSGQLNSSSHTSQAGRGEGLALGGAIKLGFGKMGLGAPAGCQSLLADGESEAEVLPCLSFLWL